MHGLYLAFAGTTVGLDPLHEKPTQRIGFSKGRTIASPSRLQPETETELSDLDTPGSNDNLSFLYT